MLPSFPYSDVHQLNLDWILVTLKQAMESNLRPSVVSVDGVGADLDGNVELHAIKFVALDPDSQDNTELMQEAIDSLTNGGCIYLPAGEFHFLDSLTLKAGVSIIGASGYTTQLIFDGSGNFIDIHNINLQKCKFEDLRITSSTNHSNIAIFGGSTTLAYNSAQIIFKNLFFENWACAIYGLAVPGDIGIFDSYFENIWCDNCTYGFQLGGSGNVFINPRLTKCTNGFVFCYNGSDSMDGATIIGGVFVANNNDLYFDNNKLRPIHIFGTWFEQSAIGIIQIHNAGCEIPILEFNNCSLNTNSTGPECLNFYNAGDGITKVVDCHFVQTISAAYKYQYTASVSGSKTIIRDCVATDYLGALTVMTDLN